MTNCGKCGLNLYLCGCGSQQQDNRFATTQQPLLRDSRPTKLATRPSTETSTLEAIPAPENNICTLCGTQTLSELCKKCERITTGSVNNLLSSLPPLLQPINPPAPKERRKEWTSLSNNEEQRKKELQGIKDFSYTFADKGVLNTLTQNPNSENYQKLHALYTHYVELITQNPSLLDKLCTGTKSVFRTNLSAFSIAMPDALDLEKAQKKAQEAQTKDEYLSIFSRISLKDIKRGRFTPTNGQLNHLASEIRKLLEKIAKEDNSFIAEVNDWNVRRTIKNFTQYILEKHPNLLKDGDTVIDLAPILTKEEEKPLDITTSVGLTHFRAGKEGCYSMDEVRDKIEGFNLDAFKGLNTRIEQPIVRKWVEAYNERTKGDKNEGHKTKINLDSEEYKHFRKRKARKKKPKLSLIPILPRSAGSTTLQQQRQPQPQQPSNPPAKRPRRASPEGSNRSASSSFQPRMG